MSGVAPRVLRALLAIFLALWLVPASAAQCKDVRVPDVIEAAGVKLALNGLGVRKATLLKISVYVAALYVTRPTRSAAELLQGDTPSELRLTFLRNVSAAELRNGFDEGFAKNTPAGSSGLSARIATLEKGLRDIRSGQQLAFARLPGQGVAVSIDGIANGVIAGDDFARALWSIWLGAAPPNPELKSGLLGGACQ